MEYHLYPPFFVIEPQISLDEAWEAFCCELLNLENQTHFIRRRLPPDQGCDLLWEKEKIAYQCKAVEGKLNLSKIRESIETAKKYQAALGWKKYVLCTNVDFTGSQEQKIRAMLPEIEFLPLTYWLALCKKFPQVADSRCRRLITIPSHSVVHAMDEAYLHAYATTLQEQLNESSFTLLVYSNFYDKVFELPVSPKFTVQDVLGILIKLFRLPRQMEYKDLEMEVSLRYSLVINGERVPFTKRLEELSFPSGEKPFVTFRKEVAVKDKAGYTQVTALHFLHEKSTSKRLSSWERSRTAVDKYKQEIKSAFAQAISTFGENKSK